MGELAYADFVAAKAKIDPPTGLSAIPDLPPGLFPFQHDITAWALRRGRAAIFAGTGLGKSFMELAWANAIHEYTGAPVLILSPLAVAAQMKREADKFGIRATHCKTMADVDCGISITNYQKLQHFDPSEFAGIVLDESSILKSLDGKTKSMLIETFSETPYRLAATATPAPNDFMELGNHAEFLGTSTHSEMLSTFFVHDGGETQKWRLKRHAESDFWLWMCSWAVMLRKPSDLGYDDSRYDLPELIYQHHLVPADYEQAADVGMLFPLEAVTMQERLSAKRASISGRVAKAASVVSGGRPNEPWFVWCHLNSEQDALEKLFKGACFSVRGSMPEDEKEAAILAWIDGDRPIMISKPSVMGFGLNLQHCCNTVFVGLNDSFEQVYQAIRRFWRFGQDKPVTVHFVASELEGAVVQNIQRKELMADQMADQMISFMADITSDALHGTLRRSELYNPEKDMELPRWM